MNFANHDSNQHTFVQDLCQNIQLESGRQLIEELEKELMIKTLIT